MSDQQDDQPEKQTHEKVSEFVQRLRARIDSEPGLTAAGLARDSGLDVSAIRQLLSGRAKSPKLDTVLRIMEALGTTYEEFMGRSMSPAEQEILRLVTRLPAAERRQLLGYATALASVPKKRKAAANVGSPKPKRRPIQSSMI